VELSAKTLWPLFPLLLLVVVVCLTWALVRVVRRRRNGSQAIWIQAGALICYLLAAVSAIASENGSVSSNVHRPFSLLTQVFLLWAIYRAWGESHPGLVALNAIAWAAILADTALHFLLVG